MTPSLAAFARLTPDALRQSCLEARETSAAIIQDRISLGVSAVGIHFNDATGPSAGALSVATLTQRMPLRRMLDVAEQLRHACADVEKRLRSNRRGGLQASGPTHAKGQPRNL